MIFMNIIKLHMYILSVMTPICCCCHVYAHLFLCVCSDLNHTGTMEQCDSEADVCPVEGSVADTAVKEPHPVNLLHSNTSTVEEEELLSHHSGDEEENCNRANDGTQLDGELVEVELDIKTVAEAKPQAQTHGLEHLERTEPAADAGCDSNLASDEGGRPPPSNESGATLVATLDEVVENSPSVLEGTIETPLTFNDASISRDNTPTCEKPSSPSDDVGSTGSPPSSVQSPSENSPHESSATSGISNGPSSPSSDAVGSSSPASSPQTSCSTSAPSHALSSPFDTECSRKLLSQIQRSLSQESLLDELESELLACQLPEAEGGGERKGSPAVNGLTTDQDGCMVVFEKCVQYKYAQQEQAIQR